MSTDLIMKYKDEFYPSVQNICIFGDERKWFLKIQLVILSQMCTKNFNFNLEALTDNKK